MSEPLTLGLIGAGRIGRVHADNVLTRLPAARILAVADVNLAAAQRCAADFAIPAATDDYHALLADPAIRAVLICSATDTHARIITEAAQAGKQIFCEKPIDHDLAAIDGALAAVQAAGVTLQIGFNRRFDPNFARVRALAAQGAIGVPHLLHIISRDPEPPSPEYAAVSGGIFLDMTIHDFDMARFLVGADVVEVYAAGSVLVDPRIGAAGDLDTVLVTLKFANGALGVIDNSRRAAYGYDQRVELFGSAGAARAENNFPNSVTLADDASVRRDLPYHFFMDRYTESYIAELRAFIASVRDGAPPPVSGEDGRQAICIARAARQSHAANRPVRLAEISA